MDSSVDTLALMRADMSSENRPSCLECADCNASTKMHRKHSHRPVTRLAGTLLALLSLLTTPIHGHSDAPKLNIFGLEHMEAQRFDAGDPLSLPTARIIGGKATAPDRYPYMVSLQKTFRRNGMTYYAHVCGGTLIAPDVVLTAAHCFDCQGASKCYDRIALGRHDFRSYSEMTNVNAIESGYAAGDAAYDGRLVFDISEVKEIKHPGYKYNLYTNDIGYDFALLILPNRPNSLAATGATLKPVRLNTNPAVPDGPMALTVAGWGATQTPTPQDNFLSPLLLDTTVQYVTNGQCVQAGGYVETNGVNVYYSYWNFVKDNMMCGVENNQDACVGDSGGPLIISGQNGDGSDDVQVGIVSFGVGCANADFPGIYARISDQWEWLEETVCGETRYPDDGSSSSFDCKTSAPSSAPSLSPSVGPSAPPSTTASAEPSSIPIQLPSGSAINQTQTTNETGSIGSPLANDANRVEADELIPSYMNETNTTNTTSTTTQAPTYDREGANPLDPTNSSSNEPTTMISNKETNVSQVPTMRPVLKNNEGNVTDTASNSTVGPTSSLNFSVPAPVDGSTTTPTAFPVQSSATEKPSSTIATTDKPSEQPITKPSQSPTASPVAVESLSPSVQKSTSPSKAVSGKPSDESTDMDANKATGTTTSGATYYVSIDGTLSLMASIVVSALLSMGIYC